MYFGLVIAPLLSVLALNEDRTWTRYASFKFLFIPISSDLWALVKSGNPVLTLFGIKDSQDLLTLEGTISSDSRLGSSFPFTVVSIDCKTSVEACNELGVLFAPSARLFRYVGEIHLHQYI